MRANLSGTTAAVTSASGMTEQINGPIEKVLVLNGDASSGLAALLSNLETIFADPKVTIAINQKDALLDLRLGAYGY